MIFPPQHTQIDKGHGRVEIRKIWTSTAINDYVDFPYVNQVFCLERYSKKLSEGKSRKEIVYGITSLSKDKANPERLLTLIRGHWTIENRLHYVRDFTFDEDRCRIRKGNGAHVMASIRNLVISLLRMAGAKLIAPAIRACSRMGNKVIRFLGIKE